MCVNPIYNADQVLLKVCYLNARSLHRHTEDLRTDLNYCSTDVNIFTETRFCHSDDESAYIIDKYSLFRNDGTITTNNLRPYGGTAVYSRVDYYPGYPYSCNSHGIEITAIRLMTAPHIHIFGKYRSPSVRIVQMCSALSNVLFSQDSQLNVFIGDFNFDWLENAERTSLNNLFVSDHGYKQLVSSYTADNKTCIDHVYSHVPISNIKVEVLETYFTHQKSVCALVDCLHEAV